MKVLLIVCMFFSCLSLANDNVQNRNGVFYDIKTNKKFNGSYVSKYIYTTLSGSGEIEWTFTYRYKIPMKNGIRNGTATLYKSTLAQYLDDGRVYQSIDSYKELEAHFINGKILSVKEYDNDGVLQSTTSFNKGVALRYDQKTGVLTGKFSYIESNEHTQSSREDQGYYIFTGGAYAIDGEFYVYQSDDRTRMTTYKNNIKHGPFVMMHSKEQVFLEGSYSNGKMDGDYKHYCKDGRLGTHKTYLAGEVVETFVEHDDNYCYK